MIDIDYMVKNDKKGYYGSFSKAGKNSTEIYTNIRQKDILLNPGKFGKQTRSVIDFLKRNGYHNIYGDKTAIKKVQNEELNDSQIEEIEEEVDIFKMEEKKKDETKKKKKKLKKNKTVKIFHRTGDKAYKYYDQHMRKPIIKKPDLTPNCTKYFPSKDLVWKRTIVGPKWDTMKERQPFGSQDNTKYYLNHVDPLEDIGKCFIDMNKQTMRGENSEFHDLRITTTRPFSANTTKRSNKKYKTNPKNLNTKNINNKNNDMSVFDSDFSEFDKKLLNKVKTENNSKNLKEKKRVTSAVTSSTRPQTGHPLNSNMSKRNNTSMSDKKNVTIDSKNLNFLNSHNDNKSLFEEEDITNSELNSVGSSELNDSYQQFKHYYQGQIKKKKNNQPETSNKNLFRTSNKKQIQKNNETNNNNTLKQQNNKKNVKKSRPKSSYAVRRLNINKKKNIKGPDFDKIISREYYDKLQDSGASLIPFSLPNFKLVRERPLTMVTYERKHYSKKKPKEIIGITPDMYTDILKYLECTNNHTHVAPPNFDKMKARPPDDGSPLPVYMKGAVSRGACNMTTEMSLKMNNYAEGKFLTNYTSFWPKKSHNKIVNLNLLNSDAFLSNLVKDTRCLKDANNYIAKSMKFYNKNYEDLMKEGLLTKFDNVTYKSIKSGDNKGFKYIDKFIETYGTKGIEDDKN